MSYVSSEFHMRHCTCTICTNCDCYCHTVRILITGLKQLWSGADVTGHYAHHMPLLYCVFSVPGIVQSFCFVQITCITSDFQHVELMASFCIYCWQVYFHIMFYHFFTVCDPVSICFRIVFQSFVILRVLLCSEQIIQMDDDSCVLKYIEIVPLENNAQQFEDVKPFQVKVCIITSLVV